jgi:pimeloyl-ACP methyl ester carboxylesterase
MQRPSASYSGVWRVKTKRIVCIAMLIIVVCILAGCVTPGTQRTYTVSDSGVLSLNCGSVPATVTQIEKIDNHTPSRVVFHTPSGDVYAVYSSPEKPSAAFVFAPGAGVKKEWHIQRAERYADAGYAFLVMDLRGNGGETPGYRFSLDEDYKRFTKEEWPQYYETVCDLVAARAFLEERYDAPVFLMGDSNGGRIAAIAAASDPGCAGFIGVSTSGFNMTGDHYTGDSRRFLLSVDPDVAVTRIAPRPVWIFHAPADTIIPFSDGRRLYDMAGEPKRFVSFKGTHGSNEEVDRILMNEFIPQYLNSQP